MSEKFDVRIHVLTAAKLATIMPVLDGEAKLVSVEQIEDKTKRKARIVRRHVNGETGADIVMALAKGGHEITVEQVAKVFHEKGLSKSSAAPRLSECVQTKDLALVRKGVYKILPKTRG